MLGLLPYPEPGVSPSACGDELDAGIRAVRWSPAAGPGSPVVLEEDGRPHPRGLLCSASKLIGVRGRYPNGPGECTLRMYVWPGVNHGFTGQEFPYA